MAVALAALIVFAATGWIVFGLAERYFLRQLASQNEATLQLVSAGIDGALRRYDPLPALIADKEDVRQLLALEPSPTEIDAINVELKRIAAQVGASDIYVMDRTGLTIAASNFDRDTSFVGRNFSFRPYFADAMEGSPSRYFAFGTTSLKRGYYFSAPVRRSGTTIGVVALKIEVDALEVSWRGVGTKMIVSDKNDVIFMSNEPDWLFKTMSALDETTLSEIRDSRRYPVERLSPLTMQVKSSGIDGAQLRIVGEDRPGRTYLSNLSAMPEAGWTLHVLTSTAAVTGRAATVMTLVLLAMVLAGLIAVIVLQRRRRLMRDIERQRRGRQELERRVKERTRDLDKANRRLTDEVKERTNAEKQLRSAQRELIQAGKLAALGQMSAALSHELNQPLAAIKSYADNAKAFLKRGHADRAGENIGHISQMADRMAEIGTHLRNFARKPKQKVDVVSLADVFAATSQIISVRLNKTPAKLHIEPITEPIWVMGGSVRLQQVIINLINNALDAMAEMPEQRIDIHTERKAEQVLITVRDNGPGLDEQTIDQIFDPFFTTRGVNEGLGLGLSISYNIIQDFGGQLSAANHPDGGAIFTIALQNADAVRSAAE